MLPCKFCFIRYTYRRISPMNVKTHCAYLLVACDDDKRINIMTQIKQVDGFKEIMETSGAWEIIAKIEMPTSDNLQKHVLDRLKKLLSMRSYIILHCKFNEISKREYITNV